MPYDSQGNFTRLHNWEQDRLDDIDIVTDHHDAEDDNFSEGLSQCFLKDGRAAMKGNFNAGGFQVKNMSDGALSNDGVNKSQLDAKFNEMKSILNSSLKIGDIKTSALQSDHDNWLLCNGREVSRTTYNELFDAIGTAFGNGNNSSTFNIPDCRGVVVRGVDNSKGYDAGRILGSYQADAAKNITAGFTRALTAPDAVLTGAFTKGADVLSPLETGSSTGSARIINYNFNAQSVWGSGSIANEFRMKNIALNYFIKVKGD